MNLLTAVLPRCWFFALTPVLLALALCGCGGPEKRQPSGVRVTPGATRAPRPQPPPAYSAPRVVTPPSVFQTQPPPPPQYTPPPPVVPRTPPSPAPVRPAARPQWIPLQTWAAQLGFSAPVRVGPMDFQVRSGAGAFQFTVGKRAATWNGHRFHLGFAPAATNGVPFIHSLDADKNLAPLLQVNRPVARGRGVIVLDPGHGGPDNGTRSAQGNEKDYTLDWARRLKPLLEARGWKVVLTRTADRGVELPERVLIAEQYQADIFLSLHLNAAATPGAAGLETFCLTPAGMASTLTRNYADPANIVLPGNSQDFENMRLAMRVHRSLLQTAGMPDRGVQRARFMAVLKTQQRPAILIEAGYLSDRNEARLIHTAEYRQKLALAVAKALE
ncbi:MAG: N-acetylmuramoyl-L-alanine amidase [Limisphaerales bacterium]|nr:MAG: N-acetylmuramoyl-L-alanine amidase [Limisphaerales bacterium]KAG0509425.1 MAG: N-acetylmuramoyl-L-alanine amidase [Limisphaerales bacterium]TXT52262.1 MAG: N-acetylmuramoyl-L-alanine amidase [Limisphaerales bacterium]